MKNEKGFSLVELLVVVIIIAIIAAIAIPNLLASRRAANEASAISTLRTYHSGQATYQATLGGGVNYATNAQLVGLVDSILSAASPVTKSGYVFTAAGTLPTVYCYTAAPSSASTGTRTFGIGVDGVVNAAPGAGIACTAATGVITGGTPVGN